MSKTIDLVREKLLEAKQNGENIDQMNIDVKSHAASILNSLAEQITNGEIEVAEAKIIVNREELDNNTQIRNLVLKTIHPLK